MSVSERSPLPARIAGVLKRARSAEPRVHCLTSIVAQRHTADMLQALGAIPSMSTALDDIDDFVKGADALLVDMGALDQAGPEILDKAAQAACRAQIPWVLDPAMIDRSPGRCAHAERLLACGPDILRANVAELLALVPPTETIAGFAHKRKTTVVLSGVVDTVSDGARQYALANGHALMGRVPAIGAAMSAVMAATLAAEPDAQLAAATGVSIVNIAGEIAAENAAGPGSLAVAIIDALHGLNGGELRRRLEATRESLEGTDLVAQGPETQ